MAYSPTPFVDLPSTATPITATELNKMGAAIKASLWLKSVRDYGAILDDSTDDSTAVAAAVTAASAAGGGIVLVDGRCYMGTTTLTVPSSVVIWGISKGNSYLRWSASMTNPCIDLSGANSASHNSWQGISNIGIRGTGTTTGQMVRAYYVDRLTISDVFFYNSTGKCLDFVEVWDTRVTRCAFNHVGGTATDTPATGWATSKPIVHLRNASAPSGFGASTDNCNMIWFVDCHFEDYASGALWIERGDPSNSNNPNGIFITHGKFETNRVRNIPIVIASQASLVHFRDCDVVLAAFDSGVSTAVDGILMNGVSNILVDGVRFVGNNASVSMANGINATGGNSAGSYAIRGISHEGTAPSGAVVSWSSVVGKWEVGAVTSTNSATLFSAQHPYSQSSSPTTSVTPTVNAGRTSWRYTLSGNLTINNPTGQIAIGDRLALALICDGTGRTMTWGGQYKTTVTGALTVSKTTYVEFEWNGTNWIQIGTPVAV